MAVEAGTVAPRRVFAAGPVLAAMAAQAAVLTAVSNVYGYHRDELYFRMLRPAWGYVDQPPLTPMLARLTEHIADAAWALRIPATIASIVSVLLVALITREVGGSRLAQGLAAWGYAFGSFPLIIGHVFLTASIDATVWLAALFFLVRAMLHDRPRAWLWAGLIVGVGLYNKLLIVVLLVALLAGFLLVGPRRLLVSRYVLAAVAVAIVVGLPNIVYQAANGWPQLTFGRQLSAHDSGDVHTQMWYLLPLLLGPPLVLVWGAGIVALLRRPAWRALRFLAPAFAALLALVYVMGSQPYYEFGLLSALFAVGCAPTADWLARGGRGRVWVLGVLGGLNAVISALIALPLIPVTTLGSTPIPGINQTARDTVGWPAYVSEVAAAYDEVPAGERPHAVVIASNYGEAGAVARYGPAHGLPAVYSGQNQLYYRARPPASATVAVVVGGQLDEAKRWFASCRVVGHLDNHVDVDNEEQGEPIAICRNPHGGWIGAWPKFRHED